RLLCKAAHRFVILPIIAADLIVAATRIEDVPDSLTFATTALAPTVVDIEGVKGNSLQIFLGGGSCRLSQLLGSNQTILLVMDIGPGSFANIDRQHLAIVVVKT